MPKHIVKAASSDPESSLKISIGYKIVIGYRLGLFQPWSAQKSILKKSKKSKGLSILQLLTYCSCLLYILYTIQNKLTKDMYIFFNPHYTMKHKPGVIRNLTHRAENVPSKAEGKNRGNTHTNRYHLITS